MRALSLVAASGGHSSSRCAGLSLSRPLLLRSTGSRHAGSLIVAHGPSCSTACGIFPDQGSNPCPLHWQADSQPLRHQGSPPGLFRSLCAAAQGTSLWEPQFIFPAVSTQNHMLFNLLRERLHEHPVSQRAGWAVLPAAPNPLPRDCACSRRQGPDTRNEEVNRNATLPTEIGRASCRERV